MSEPAPNFEIDPAFVTLVIAAAGDRDAPELRRALSGLHPADLADVFEQVSRESLRTILALVGRELPPAFLTELSWERREEALAVLPAEYVGQALAALDSDDAAAVAADLDQAKLEAALDAVDDETRHSLRETLAAEEETAGRLMQREFVAAPEYWTVGLTIDHLRAAGDALPELFFEVYVVDPGFRPIGAAPLSTILRSVRDTPLKDIMKPVEALISPEMDQEDVAFAFTKYNLASAPVVDAAGRLTGMVTIDDIVHVISEERHEDLLALSGVSEASQGGGVREAVISRAPWLFLNLVTALVSVTVIAGFGAAIEELVALAVLMPVVASLGGNAGTQALAVAVRALAARELTDANLARQVGREAATATANGIGVGLVLALAAGLWFRSEALALAIGLAVVITVMIAGLAGILVPLGLKRVGADPAVSSSVFVTFITDVVGFTAFLALGAAIALG